MSSSQAILIDLERSKLDPKKKHVSINKLGHITDRSTLVEATHVPEELPQKIVEEVVQEPTPVTLPQVEEIPSDVQEQEVESQEESTESLPKRRGRKFNTRS